MSTCVTVASASGKPMATVSFIVRRWLVLCMAAFLMASASLYGGAHAEVLPTGNGHPGAQHVVAPASAGHVQAAPCDNRQSGESGHYAPDLGCGFCAPLPLGEIAGAPRDRAVEPVLFSASVPGQVQPQWRPPRLFVTA